MIAYVGTELDDRARELADTVQPGLYTLRWLARLPGQCGQWCENEVIVYRSAFGAKYRFVHGSAGALLWVSFLNGTILRGHDGVEYSLDNDTIEYLSPSSLVGVHYGDIQVAV